VVVAIILLIVLAILPRGSSRRFPRLLAAPRVVHTALEAFDREERKAP
jgi:diacylglycerol kinase family enzyme